VAGVEDGEESLDADYEDASAVLDAVLAEIDALKSAERDGERERDALVARRDALQLGLNRKDGSGRVADSGLPGIVGPLASMLAVEAGYEAAIAAALGNSSDAIVVRDTGTAAEALQLLKDDDAGIASLLLPGFAERGVEEPASPVPARAALPDGAHWAADLVAASGPAIPGLPPTPDGDASAVARPLSTLLQRHGRI